MSRMMCMRWPFQAPDHPLPLLQVKHVEAPHPEWKPGMKQPRPDYIGQEDNYITLDPVELGNAGYPLVISAIAPRYQCSCSSSACIFCRPCSSGCLSAAVNISHLQCRPIAFIVSLDKEGQRNLRWLEVEPVLAWRLHLSAMPGLIHA